MFCDFCDCRTCQLGLGGVSHAQTESGKWICDVCYLYSVCIVAKRREGIVDGPCEGPCEHRPKVTSEWTFWTRFPADEDDGPLSVREPG